CDSRSLSIAAASVIRRRKPNISRTIREIGAFTRIFLQFVALTQSIFIQGK
ncbi:hypothetical protein KIN20_031524, partial [Parelaphostrongylus tenuis]